MARYLKPDFMTKHVFNPLIAFATRLGLSMRGSRLLEVRGRKSGALRTNPVNPLTLGDERYLVAPRGNTEWVRNIRAAGEADLRLGRKREHIRVEEVPDEAKPDILRAYLRNWKAETGKFFGGVDADAPESTLREIAPNHPVFRIRT